MDIAGTLISAIVLAVVTALATYVMTRRTEAAKRLEELRANAYTDFVRELVGMLEAHGKQDAEAFASHRGRFLDARARLVIYGSRAAIAALHAMSARGGMNEDDLPDLAQAMRSDFPGLESVDDNVIKVCLHGSAATWAAKRDEAARARARELE